tara:strand:+ start:1120 stop:1254 length:135 start_codon:yes stop_codon:yes gene_type:complete
MNVKITITKNGKTEKYEENSIDEALKKINKDFMKTFYNLEKTKT